MKSAEQISIFFFFLFRSRVAKNQTRPWSASESRLQAADPVFHMRQRHWEGLAAGTKKLHRGQLLPGSTSEEEVQARLEERKLRRQSAGVKQSASCWSEGTSPARKSVSFSTEAPRIKEPSSAEDFDLDEERLGARDLLEPAGEPIVKAIKDELQKFQRPKSPNLAGITIINDPNLAKKESDA